MIFVEKVHTAFYLETVGWGTDEVEATTLQHDIHFWSLRSLFLVLFAPYHCTDLSSDNVIARRINKTLIA
jgi:hypothetical protein